MRTLLVVLLAAAPAFAGGPVGPAQAGLTTERKWTPTDATRPSPVLLQQDLSDKRCNWVRLVEAGRGEPVRPWDGVRLRVSGYVTKAGSAYWGQRLSVHEPLEHDVELSHAAEGLQAALDGVAVGSLVHLVAGNGLVAPIDGRFHAGGATQVHLLIEVLKSKPRAKPLAPPRPAKVVKPPSHAPSPRDAIDVVHPGGEDELQKPRPRQ